MIEHRSSSTVEYETHVGDLIAEARRRAGLTQKKLATRLGISLWTLDRLESGLDDPSPHIPAIANATGVPHASLGFVGPLEMAATQAEKRSTEQRLRERTSSRTGRDVVIGSILLLVVIRFFTEVVPVLPRAANFVDIPILLGLGMAAILQPAQRSAVRARTFSFALPATLFLVVCVASVVVNPSRVAAGPALVFVYGFLAPIGIYAAVVRLWPPGHASTLSRVLVALGVVQLLVVFGVDVPRFLSSGNPDVISGTFGTNPYQLVFFLLVFTALLAGIFVVEKSRLAARLAPIFFVLILGAIFLAQYRALLITTAVTIILIGILLRPKGRGVLVGAFIVVSFVIALSYVASSFPGLRFASTIAALGEPRYLISERLRSSGTFVHLYTDKPFSMLIGTGPGTFSSRGWQTFANAGSTSQSNVAGQYVSSLTGSGAYRTDVSDAYVLPQLRSGRVIEGSKAVTSPYSSYSSLLAEVGLIGFLIIVGVYLRALFHAWSMTVRALSTARPDDPLPAVLLASTIAFSLLLQMAFLENWLEVTRVTFLAWALLAVATKEFSARDESTA